MLSKEDNEFLCRIGPGTPMGNLMRNYWLPAIRSDELPEPDGRPLRVRLLGEDLIGWRSSDGEVGLVANNCPHRGASLFFGRNEDAGLRCVYHGWKFDTTGRCIDMPNEPPESNFKDKVHAVAYPTRERGGIIWAYMGTREVPPPLPDLEATLVNTDPKHISMLHRKCNWMQGLEGELDTVHAAFLHGGASRPEEQEPKSLSYYHYSQRAPRFAVLNTEWGTSYGAYRPAEEDSHYWRIAHMLFPCYAMQPTGPMGENAKLNAYVPMDDENLLQWELHVDMTGKDRPFRPARGEYQPTTSDWLGRFNLVQQMDNDYLLDAEAQRTWKSYSGIPGIRQQDMAVTESMGPIYKRWQEHLGTTDVMIIRTRARLIQAAKALRDRGTVPPGVDNPEVYRVRSGEVVLPRGVDWWQASADLRERFGPIPEPSR
jgi:phenylpropionate dioxygenase-like ring-hydroxylating dioxygenase large terminal subunit